MKPLLLILLTILTSAGIAQNEENKTIFKELKAGETQTITLQLNSKTPSEIGSFKDQLVGVYPEKVFDIIYNEANQVFSFTFNENMQREDLVKLFEHHKIPYLRKTTISEDRID